MSNKYLGLQKCVDEVGVGSLFGRIVASALFVPDSFQKEVLHIKESKILTLNLR